MRNVFASLTSRRVSLTTMPKSCGRLKSPLNLIVSPNGVPGISDEISRRE